MSSVPHGWPQTSNAKTCSADDAQRHLHGIATQLVDGAGFLAEILLLAFIDHALPTSNALIPATDHLLCLEQGFLPHQGVALLVELGARDLAVSPPLTAFDRDHVLAIHVHDLVHFNR